MTQESFIICDNVVRIFKIAGHDVVALQGLDMAVSPAELLGVVGVSGSGKSTLMNIIGGLDRPTAGRFERLPPPRRGSTGPGCGNRPL